MQYYKPSLKVFQGSQLLESIGPVQTAYVQFGVQQVAFNYEQSNTVEQQIVYNADLGDKIVRIEKCA